MKKIVLSLSLLLSAFWLMAQESAIYSHYLVNPTLINPGATGFDGRHNLFLHYKNQWTGFPDGPKTFALSYAGSVSEKVGIGVILNTDNLAAQRKTRGAINYAFRIQANNLRLGVGISTEFQKYSIDPGVVANPLVESNDLTLMNGFNGQSYFGASAGIYGEYADKFFFTFSLPNMVRTQLGGLVGVNTTTSSNNPTRSIVLGAGTKIAMGSAKFVPSLVIRKLYNSPFYVDINALAYLMEDKIFGGLTYRAGNGEGGSVGLTVGAQAGIFRFAYSGDFSLIRFQNYNFGGHELTIGLSFGKGGASTSEDQNYSN